MIYVKLCHDLPELVCYIATRNVLTSVMRYIGLDTYSGNPVLDRPTEPWMFTKGDDGLYNDEVPHEV